MFDYEFRFRLPAWSPVLILFATCVYGMNCSTASAQSSDSEMVLFGPKVSSNNKITTQGVRIERPSNEELKFTAPPSDGYPHVQFEFMDTPLRLNAFDALEADVFNPGDKPLKVVLSTRNPGSRGRDGSSAAAATVPANASGVIRVAFGSWHGQT
ncbi:hypothetical protein [Rhodopirellula bahusiensis]|uniref:hypothetical protein n=1 Tax=Rhodopirellula bahusiensis TaxID=2014065 RepID=UPI00326551F3